jgi:glycosyltransferase involved in cell wall biosynthesis
MPRLLSIFNDYLQRGGEAEGVRQICDSLRPVLELRECLFSSSAWTGPAAPNRVRQALWMIRNPQSVAALRDIHQAFQPDAWLVHNVFPVGSGAIYPEAERLGVPVIQYLHNFRPFSVNGYLWAGGKLATGGLRTNFFQEIRHGAWQGSRVKTAWFGIVLKLMHALGWWRGVRAWIAISDFLRDKMIEAGLPATDVFTLHYCWHLRAGATASPVDGTHYLFLGRLIEAKGIVVLLQAWKKLEQQLGPRTPRLIIGGGGPLEDWVAARAAELRTVTFAGQLSGEEKRLALIGARALIAPSLWWEALGLVAYEAYDYSKPVLAAKSGGLSETVFHGRTGLLHAPGDADQLADQVAELDGNYERRRQMGREGRLWLEANMDEEQWREKFLKILAYATRKRSP